MDGWKKPITEMFNGIINKSRKKFNINQFKSGEAFSSMFKLIDSEYYHGGTRTISNYYTTSFESEVNLDDFQDIDNFIFDYEDASLFLDDGMDIIDFKITITYNGKNNVINIGQIPWRYPYISGDAFRILNFERSELVDLFYGMGLDAAPVYYYNGGGTKQVDNNELLCSMVKINYYKLIKELGEKPNE